MTFAQVALLAALPAFEWWNTEAATLAASSAAAYPTHAGSAVLLAKQKADSDKVGYKFQSNFA